MRIAVLSLRAAAALAAALLAALAAKVYAGPWPEQISIGLGYGECAAFYKPLTLEQAQLPARLAQLRDITRNQTAMVFGLADGKYVRKGEQAILSSASTEEARGYPHNLCVSTRDAIFNDTSTARATPMGHDKVRHIAVQVSSLQRVNGSACAIFTRQGRRIAAGCLGQSLASDMGDRLILAFRLGSSLYLTLGTQSIVNPLPGTEMPAYLIVGLDY